MPSKPPVHRPQGQLTAQQRDRLRPNASSRGYGPDWRLLRQRVPRTPCVKCDARWETSHHLDHIKARRQGGSDDPSNLQWLCQQCHGRKTATSDNPYNRRGGTLL